MKKPRRPLIAKQKTKIASTNTQTNPEKLKSALSLHHQGLLGQAEKLYQEILQSEPHHFEALHLLATIAAQRNDPLTAIKMFEQALKINPNHPYLLNNHGNVLRELKRFDQALACYDQALAIKPNFAEAFNNRGNVLRDLNLAEQALNSFNLALAFKPNYTEAYNNRGNALRDLRRFQEALESYNQALDIRPHDSEALNNRGAVLRDLNRPEQALDSYKLALVVKPNDVDVLVNRGNALRELRRFEQALDNYQQALAIAPNHAEAHWNESLCRLLLGDFAVGWQKYEWRWKKQPLVNSLRNFSQPLWLGKEPLNNKTILLHSEQGFGDTIQFCRYATQVAKLGATVILEVQPALKRLLTHLEGIGTVIGKGEPLPHFDCYCPLLSLPLAFNTDLSTMTDSSYLKVDPQKKSRMATKTKQ